MTSTAPILIAYDGQTTPSTPSTRRGELPRADAVILYGHLTMVMSPVVIHRAASAPGG